MSRDRVQLAAELEGAIQEEGIAACPRPVDRNLIEMVRPETCMAAARSLPSRPWDA